MRQMDIQQVLDIAPHRYPMLLVDRALEVTDTYVKAIKNVTINEPVFQGHFPSIPIYPGVLQIEGIAQSSGILIKQYCQQESIIALFLKVDEAFFLHEIRPGDQMLYEVRLNQRFATMFKLDGTISVAGKTCTKARVMVGYKSL